MAVCREAPGRRHAIGIQVISGRNAPHALLFLVAVSQGFRIHACRSSSRSASHAVRQGEGDAPSASAAGSALPLRRSDNSRPHLGPKTSAGRCALPSGPSRRAGVASRNSKGTRSKSRQHGRATMAGKNEEVLVEAFMTKRSQNKRTFTHTNWKERWFVLSPKNLIYYDGDKQSGRRKERGRVELIRVVAVESVDTAVFQRDFVFQLCYLSEDDDQYVLYIAAPTAQDREQWLDYIRKLVADNDCLSDKYHQGAFIKSQWSCCKGGKNTIACTDVTWTINHNNNPPGVFIFFSIYRIASGQVSKPLREVGCLRRDIGRGFACDGASPAAPRPAFGAAAWGGNTCAGAHANSKSSPHGKKIEAPKRPPPSPATRSGIRFAGMRGAGRALGLGSGGGGGPRGFVERGEGMQPQERGNRCGEVKKSD
ncbi:hypothetical protein C7M84_013224 [Penaeus vannamei]|uniref:PH domain-containing protein n=1 Tax=Penaeus vannamei TaxID=6689 RepID=A0A423SWR1_PENVA|nr:hypothetical protein C7M84_013224 [Penaeus vannamei]